MSDNILIYENSDKGIKITGLVDKESASEIIIPDTIGGKPVTTIGKNAFENRENLKSVKLGKNIRYIEAESFAGSGITGIYLSENIEYIGDNAFQLCEDLKRVVWNCTTPISEQCFCGCSSLHHFDFSNVIGIKSFAFMESGLKEVQLNDNIEYIEEGAFCNCTLLNNVAWNCNLCIPNSCFDDCRSLANFDFSKVLDIGGSAFSGTKLTEIKLNDNIEHIGAYAFANCQKIKNIIWRCSDEIPEGCFCNNASLENFDFSNITNIGRLAFYGTGLREVQLNENIKCIGEEAFSDCRKLKKVDWKCKQPIPEDCFRFCTSLKDIDLSNTTEIGKYAFGESGLEKIQLEKNIQKIGVGAFSDCPNLKKMIWHCESSISRGCFENCESLSQISFEKIKTIGMNAFSNTGITSVRIEKGINIGKGCFSNCKNLRKVEWQSNKEIKSGTFENCPNLKEVLVSEQVKTIEADTFKNSPNAEISFI